MLGCEPHSRGARGRDRPNRLLQALHLCVGIRRLVVQIKAIEKDDLTPLYLPRVLLRCRRRGEPHGGVTTPLEASHIHVTGLLG